MNIGIIGAGHVGGTLARLWAKAGHKVMISSRHPEELTYEVSQLGRNAESGTCAQAARFGDVVFLAIPMGAIVDVFPQIIPHIGGKIVLDAMNPFPQRDGDVALDILERDIASGEATQQRLPKARVVRAFSSVHYKDLRQYAHDPHHPISVPYAGNDKAAKEVAAKLIRDAGFEPFDLGSLADSRAQDPSGVLFGKSLTRDEIRAHV
ncbi:MAG: NADPH-dependent F420 reductase [Chitinivibrionales bacterium]